MSRYFLYVDENNDSTEWRVLANCGIGFHVVSLATFDNRDAAYNYIEQLPYNQVENEAGHIHKYISDEALLNKFSNMTDIYSHKTIYELRKERELLYKHF